jgi:hypothetical protein
VSRSKDTLLDWLDAWESEYPKGEFRPALEQFKDELRKGLSNIPLADIRRKRDRYAKHKAALLAGHPQLERLSSLSPFGRVEREYDLCEAFIDAANTETALRSRQAGHAPSVPVRGQKDETEKATDHDVAKREADTEESKRQDADHSNERFTHSADYRSVAFRGKNFSLTARQAKMIEILHKAHANGNPDISTDYIMAELETKGSRWQDTFKSSLGARKALIATGARKGTLRLNL